MIGQRIKAERERLALAERAAFAGPRRGPNAQEWSKVERFSQAAVAAQLNRTQSWLSKLEKGERAIAVYDIYQLAEVLAVPATVLLARPSDAEAALIEGEVEDVARRREKAQITPAAVARLKEESLSGRLRSTPRSPREQQRLALTRRLPDPPRGRKRGPKKKGG